MTTVFACPLCQGAVTDVVRTHRRIGEASRSTPGLGFDNGYCPRCSRFVMRNLDTGEIETDPPAEAPPLCRECRRPLRLHTPASSMEYRAYACQDHPAERCAYVPHFTEWRWEESS